jgi:hypothetical protein
MSYQTTALFMQDVRFVMLLRLLLLTFATPLVSPLSVIDNCNIVNAQQQQLTRTGAPVAGSHCSRLYIKHPYHFPFLTGTSSFIFEAKSKWHPDYSPIPCILSWFT